MAIDIGRIDEDLYEARMMDIDAEVQKRIAGIREQVIKEQEERIAELEKLKEMLDYYTCPDDDEEDEAEASEEAETEANAEEVPTTIEE